MSMSTSCARAPEAHQPGADEVIDLFDQLFSSSESTVLRGGADEPLYKPGCLAAGSIGSGVEPHAVIYFRHDYIASAFHEIAHWCIAGEERRRQQDYGYWYAPDGRSADQQALFFQVEACPQAIEWYFAQAVGAPFNLSIDNLDGEADPADTARFARAVVDAVQRYSETGLPQRAQVFFVALCQRYGREVRIEDLAPMARTQLL
jgi:hypothetical protein